MKEVTVNFNGGAMGLYDAESGILTITATNCTPFTYLVIGDIENK